DGWCPAGTARWQIVDASGTRETWCKRPDGTAHGPYERVDVDGGRLREGRFAGGLPDGVWRVFHAGTAQVAREEGFASGLPHGVWKAWDVGGALLYEHPWAHGRACGIWRDFASDGHHEVDRGPCEDVAPPD